MIKLKKKHKIIISDGETKMFRRFTDDIFLDFKLEDGKIIDKQTSSVWDYNGLAIEGKLKDT